jgi:non-reducing end alpha-L-arabinofuranosidase
MKSMFRLVFLAAAVLTGALFISMFGISGVQAQTSGPCDIYGAAGNPCVAAHSTTRALFAAYSGKLYQVQRASDKAKKDIGTLSPGGYADAAAQDSFCAGTKCTTTVIYDQSSQHNDLHIGGNGGYSKNVTVIGVNSADFAVYAGGHKVYSIYTHNSGQPGQGYRDTNATGTATGSQPEGTYMVASGTHTSSDGQCCFDYGNVSQPKADDYGPGTMDAISIGKDCWFKPCQGTGPWVQDDMESGMFNGANGSYLGNTGRPNTEFISAFVKNNGTSTYAIKDGDATKGSLVTQYNGSLPTQGGYIPAKKQGGIALGTGGDMSDWAQGTFYEGAMVTGYPSDATENAVQANIVSVGYSLTKPIVEAHYADTRSNPPGAVHATTGSGSTLTFTSSLPEILTVSLFSPNGRLLQVKTFGARLDMDISSLNAGLYFIRVEGKSVGNLTTKFLKN